VNFRPEWFLGRGAAVASAFGDRNNMRRRMTHAAKGLIRLPDRFSVLGINLIHAMPNPQHDANFTPRQNCALFPKKNCGALLRNLSP
jgi:hypothetical protein